MIQRDKAIATAEERSRKVASSPEEMRYYEAVEDARREMISAQKYSFREGEAEGLAKGKAEGKAEGEARLNELLTRLKEDNRIDELLRVTADQELKEKLYKEYEL